MTVRPSVAAMPHRKLVAGSTISQAAVPAAKTRPAAGGPYLIPPINPPENPWMYLPAERAGRFFVKKSLTPLVPAGSTRLTRSPSTFEYGLASWPDGSRSVHRPTLGRSSESRTSRYYTRSTKEEAVRPSIGRAHWAQVHLCAPDVKERHSHDEDESDTERHQCKR